MPEVTIGLPVYNGERTISRVLDCLLGQTFQDFEIVISDNASTDGTEQVCRARAASNSRIRYIRQPTNLGPTMNFRAVLFQARSPFFMWAAADDAWSPRFVEAHVAVLRQNPQVVLSQCRVLFIDNGKPANLSSGTYALPDDWSSNVLRYLTNPSDNSRLYGLYRTPALQAVFPNRRFFAYDWGVAVATLRYGTHHEVPDVLMLRDTSPPESYQRLVSQDHNSWFWRTFPMLFLTQWLLLGRRIPITAPVLGRLLWLNVYIHMRFGLYRWKTLADTYLDGTLHGKQDHSLAGRLASAIHWVAAPGLRLRLQTVRQRLRRLVRRAAVFPARLVWRLLPLTVPQRQAIKRWVMRQLARSENRPPPPSDPLVQHPVLPTAPQAPAPPLSTGLWTMPEPDAGTAPEISLVVVTCDDLQRLLALIDSFAAAQTGMHAELVVVDNGSTDATPLALSGLPGIVYRRLPTTQPYTAAAAEGMRAAGAETLALIEHGMTIDANFLRQCLAGLRAAEMVGPMVRTPDGALQAAGGILDPDRTLLGYGAGQDAREPRYRFAREVDFCPGAFAIRRHTLAELGSLDPGYAGFVIAALDLATRLKRAGRRVLYWPAASITDWSRCADGLPLATDGSHAADWQRFAASHAALLDDLRGQSRYPHDRSRTRRLLFIDAELPRPDHSAGALLAVNLMRMLDAMGFRVSFTAEYDIITADDPYVHALQAMGIEMLYTPYVFSPGEALERVGGEVHAVALCRVGLAETYLDAIRRRCPQAPVIFNPIDLHFVRALREAELRNDARLMDEAQRLRGIELQAVAASDATVVVSTHEAEVLREALPSAVVHVVPLLFEVPARLDVPGFDSRRDMLFVGTYRHPPNNDAATYFAREIWPLVRERLPEARFLVAGSHPTEAIHALAGNGVEVLGFVEDLDELLSRCRVSVAPLRFGAGLKGKVASSLLAGVPVVASPVAVEGTPLIPGEEMLLADTPEQFADAVVRLYTDPILWQRLSVNGFSFVAREYSLQANVPRLRAALRDAGVSLDEPADAGVAAESGA